MSYSRRNTRVKLLLRKAREFVSDARVRFSGEDRLDECLDAFRAMIDDIARSNRTVLQIEKIAKRIDEEFETSLNETMIILAVDLVSFTHIDLLAYPGFLSLMSSLFLVGYCALHQESGCREITSSQLSASLRETGILKKDSKRSNESSIQC